MCGWWRWTVGAVIMASAVCTTALTAQAAPASKAGPWSDVCSLASSEEFQQANGVDPRIGIIPDTPTATEMVWGPHCDYSPGAIDLFTKKDPKAELERVLELTKAIERRDAVQGLGDRAFFTVVYPGDEYRQRGLLAVFLGPRVVAVSMDPYRDEPVENTRPKLERLAKLILPRLQ